MTNLIGYVRPQKLEPLVTLLSGAIGSRLAVKVTNVTLFHALLVDTVKMTHSVILRFFLQILIYLPL